LFTNEIDLQVNVHDAIPRSARELFDSLGMTGAIEYEGIRVSGNAFFQVNRFLIRRLVETAVSDSEGDTALDLYAGAGLFARALAKRFRTVTAVESGGGARGGLAWKSIRASVEEFLPSVAGAPDLILADPPRAGLGTRATAELVRIRAPYLTLVSCEPPTLARDLARLIPAYEIIKMTLVDLFPRTAHMEIVVHLRAH